MAAKGIAPLGGAGWRTNAEPVDVARLPVSLLFHMQSMNSKSLLQTLRDCLSQSHAAARVRTQLQPVGGDGDKFFPPTYEGGTYAEEERLIDGREERSVLVNSVAAEAARLEGL